MSLGSFQVAGPFASHTIHEDTFPYHERATSHSGLPSSTVSPSDLQAVSDKSKDNAEVYDNANVGNASVPEQMVDEVTDTKTNSAAHSRSPLLPGNVSGIEATPAVPSIPIHANLPTEIRGPHPLQDSPQSSERPPIADFDLASSSEHPTPLRADPRGTKKSRLCDLKCVSSISD